MRGNCLLYALGKWLTEGGYILVRRSHIAAEFGVESAWHPARFVPHFLHRSHSKVVTQFVPTTVQKRRDARRGAIITALLGVWWFEGKVVGDDE